MAIGVLFCSLHAHAEKLPLHVIDLTPADTYESCSVHAWEFLKDADGFERKVPLEDALNEKGTAIGAANNLRKIYKLAEDEGVAAARISVFGNYAFCMKDVKVDTAQTVFSRKPAYLSCGEEAAINFRILTDLSNGKTADDLYAVLPNDFHEKIRMFADLIKNKSLDQAVSSASDTTESCIEAFRTNTN